MDNCGHRSLVIWLTLSVSVFGQRIQLDDERINARWQEAREYNLTSICYMRNTFMDCSREIGLPGVRHTLGGMEFPWKHPGGRFRSDLTRKFVWPVDIQANTKTAHYKPLRGVGREWSRPSWQWPIDATFFELHYHPRGHAFELRALEKIDDTGYEPHIYRPFSSPEDLPFTPALERVRTLEVHSGHGRRPFVHREKVHYYVDANVRWSELVDRLWVDDLGHEWHHAGTGDGWLTPQNYSGWMIGNGQTCVKCHDAAGAPVDYFDVAGRDWYGFHRGADMIFSFDPVDRRTVSFSGPHGGGFRWARN